MLLIMAVLLIRWVQWRIEKDQKIESREHIIILFFMIYVFNKDVCVQLVCSQKA